jgi:2-phospho-L-lactate guanylyltransferase
MTSNATGTLCALVAIKSRAHCKSRLASALTGPARVALVRSMLSNVLTAVEQARCVQRVFVISPERDAVPSGIPLIADSGTSLNAALAQARAQLLALGCTEALVLPADLPHLSDLEVEAFVEVGRRSGFAIASDIARQGTNALYLPTSEAFTFRFGADSLRLHLQEAARLGLAPQVVELPGLAFDVDEPADLQALVARRGEALREDSPWQRLAPV